MWIKRFISNNRLMRLWDLSEWIWNQKGRPTGWNLRQELTLLLSWGRISSSFKKPQVLLLGSSSDWTRPPQCWEVLSCKFWWWLWTTPTKHLHSNIWTSVFLNQWRLLWPNWHKTGHHSTYQAFILCKILTLYINTVFCSPLGFTLESVICA